MDHIEALLERIADAVAPTEEQRALRAEDEEFHRSVHSLIPSAATKVNAIAGPNTYLPRGVR